MMLNKLQGKKIVRVPTKATVIRINDSYDDILYTAETKDGYVDFRDSAIGKWVLITKR